MLQGQVVIVTGGSQGIGQSIALACAREGASVVIAARTRAKLDAVIEEMRVQGNEGLAVPTDVTDEIQVSRMVETTLARYG